jgi:transposase
MGMLEGQVDFVIGVDSHKNSLTAAVVTPAGGVQAHITVPTDAFGAGKLLAFAAERAQGRRVWAIEGTGCFASGFTTFLLEREEWVVEVDRPARLSRRDGAKSDEIDAVRAAREALSRSHLAQPRCRGDREAIRVLLITRQGAVVSRTRAICHLKSLLVTAPQGLRDQLRRWPDYELVARCSRLRTCPSKSVEHNWTVWAIRSTARRVLVLEAEANDLETQLEELVKRHSPKLLAEPGVGVITAGQIICSWSHPGRIRSEAAFAALAGAAPVPASSGQTVRYRLNRGGDRQLNRALHAIVLSRMVHHAETKRYVAKRTAEGKTPREIKRCLKRHLARRLFRLLEAAPPA